MDKCESSALGSFPHAYYVQPDHVGDQICIFGFSRGAYTARALAGMVQKVGLLPQSNIEQLPFACALYPRDDDEAVNMSLKFKRTFSIDVRIKFLGVWYVIRLDQFLILYLHLGTPWNPSGWFQRTYHSAERTMPLRISVTRWLWTSAVSSSLRPSTKAENPSKTTRIQRVNRRTRTQWSRRQIPRFR